MRHCVRLFIFAAAVWATAAHAGAPIANLQLYSPTLSFGFGDVAPGSSKQVTVGLLAPAGNTTQVWITSIVTSGADFTQSGNCVTMVLDPGSTCDLVETFTPTSIGERLGTITVTCQPFLVPLVGSATFVCDSLPHTISLAGLGGVLAAVPALSPTLVALLAAGLLVLSMLFVSRRQRARNRGR
jgi:hypothetical protein